MSRYFLIFLLALCQCAIAQETVFVANKYCIRKDTLLLFEGGNNLVQVYSPAWKGADIKIKSLDRSLKVGGEELKGDTLTCLAMPYATGRKLRLAIMNKKTGKTLKEVNFYADKLPAPVARIGSLKDTVVPKKDLLAQASLAVIFPNSLYGYPYRVQQYKFHTTYGGKSATMSVDGFWLTTGILQQVKDAPPNTIVEFTDIKAMCAECSPRMLRDLKIKVK